MSSTPTSSPWPAPTWADAAISPLPAPLTSPPSAHPTRRPASALIETVRRLASRTERAEHAGLKEEQRIRADLLDLPLGWFVLHAADTAMFPDLDAGADHVVVGPAGVFLIYLEHHLGAKVWISEHRLTID